MLAYLHTLVTCCNAQVVPGSSLSAGSGEIFLLAKPYIFTIKERSFLQRLSQGGCLLSVTQELYYRLQEGANPPAS